ncbi:hypothetical protein [Aeoliella sp.]|uniref:hypothetical protein n=1 Tax=Aeoliella sp. TaxID=2795800 RepID=UPI003CCBA55F
MSAQFELRGKSAGVVKAVRDLNTALDTSEKSFKDNAKAADAMSRAAERIVKQTEGAQARYNRKLEETNKLLKQGALSQEQAARATAYYRRKLQEAGNASEGAFGSAMITKMGAMAGGVAALHRAWSLAVELVREYRAEVEASAQKQVTGVNAKAKLVQLAGADTKKREQLFRSSDLTFIEGFIASEEASQRLTFELDSGGVLKDRAFFSKLSLIDDAATLAKSTALTRAGFAGGDDVGTSRELVSKAIAGALPATGVSPAQIAEGVSTVAPLAKKFGLSDEDVHAGVSRIAQTLGSGTEAGNAMRRLLSALARQGVADDLQGQGLEGVINFVKEQELSKAGLTKYLGSVEAAGAYDVLSDTDAFRTRLSEINAAQQNNLAGQTIRNAVEDPEIAAAIYRRRGEAVKELSARPQGIRENLSEGQQALDRGLGRTEGVPEWLMATGDFVLDTYQHWYGPNVDFRSRRGASPDALLQEQNENLRKLIELQQEANELQKGKAGFSATERFEGDQMPMPAGRLQQELQRMVLGADSRMPE